MLPFSWCNQSKTEPSCSLLFNSAHASQTTRPESFEQSDFPFISENIRSIFHVSQLMFWVNALQAFRYILAPVSITQVFDLQSYSLHFS